MYIYIYVNKHPLVFWALCCVSLCLLPLLSLGFDPTRSASEALGRLNDMLAIQSSADAQRCSAITRPKREARRACSPKEAADSRNPPAECGGPGKKRALRKGGPG